MKRSLTLSFLFLGLSPVFAQEAPVAPVRPVVEEYCGEEVTDRYRYMENMDDPEVQQWFRGQADYTRSVLDQIPGRDSLEAQLLEIASRREEEIYAVEITDNDRYFYLKTKPGEEVARLYYRDGYEGEEKRLVDPTVYDSVAGQKHVVYAHYPSWDGTKVAFHLTANGAEVGTLMVMDVASQELSSERIDRFWFGFSWLPDNERFLIMRLPTNDMEAANFLMDTKTYLHQLGTDAASDREVFSRAANPELDIDSIDFPIAYMPNARSPYVWATLSGVDFKPKRFYASLESLSEEQVPWKPLTVKADEIVSLAATEEVIYALTSKEAARFKIIKTSAQNPDFSQAETVVPETEEVIEDMVVTSDGLFYTTVKNGVEAKLYRLDLNAEEVQPIDLPTQAGVISIQAKGYYSPDLWVTLEGWNTPPTRYQYNVADGSFQRQPLSSGAEYPEFADLVIEEVTVPSHDGTMVPLSIIYQKDTPRDGTAPLLLRGYGSYGISVQPFFAPDRLLWTQQGGIFAVAHVRGGGELGDAWHRAGQKTTKPNTWKDFIACAEYLIQEDYTNSDKLAISGGSAGGILIGRAMTERPDLFAVSIPLVGSMNPLRFENTPNGPNNTKEFGSYKNPEECKALLKMDAYLHIEDSTSYPATLVTTGMNDPRVTPWGPAKFAARLQAANSSDEPALFLVDYEAGHGMAGSKPKRAELFADIFSFALWQTEHPDFQPDASAQASPGK